MNEWGIILRQFFDVSLPITDQMIVYPGKSEPSVQRYASISRDKVNESLLMLIILGTFPRKPYRYSRRVQTTLWDKRERAADLPLRINSMGLLREMILVRK